MKLLYNKTQTADVTVMCESTGEGSCCSCPPTWQVLHTTEWQQQALSILFLTQTSAVSKSLPADWGKPWWRLTGERHC